MHVAEVAGDAATVERHRGVDAEVVGPLARRGT